MTSLMFDVLCAVSVVSLTIKYYGYFFVIVFRANKIVKKNINIVSFNNIQFLKQKCIIQTLGIRIRQCTLGYKIIFGTYVIV